MCAASVSATGSSSLKQVPPGLTRDFERSAHQLGEAVRVPQPEPGALARLLGREERIEDVRQVLSGRCPAPLSIDLEARPRPARAARRSAQRSASPLRRAGRAARARAPRGARSAPARTPRSACAAFSTRFIEDLLERAAGRPRPRGSPASLATLELDPREQRLRAHALGRALEQSAPGSTRSSASASGRARSSISRTRVRMRSASLADLLRPARGVRVGRAFVALTHLRVAQDRRDGIADLVRHARRELAHARQAAAARERLAAPRAAPRARARATRPSG